MQKTKRTKTNKTTTVKAIQQQRDTTQKQLAEEKLKQKQQVNDTAIEQDDLFNDTVFNKTVDLNKQESATKKNKSVVKVDNRTYANSIVRRATDLTIEAKLTDTAIIDISIAIVASVVERATIQQLTTLIEHEFSVQFKRTRLIDHLKKNAYMKQHVARHENDVISFSDAFRQRVIHE